LKKMVAEQAFEPLDIDMLKEINRGNELHF
jgi:hypothetical protein